MQLELKTAMVFLFHFRIHWQHWLTACVYPKSSCFSLTVLGWSQSVKDHKTEDNKEKPSKDSNSANITTGILRQTASRSWEPKTTIKLFLWSIKNVSKVLSVSPKGTFWPYCSWPQEKSTIRTWDEIVVSPSCCCTLKKKKPQPELHLLSLFWSNQTSSCCL